MKGLSLANCRKVVPYIHGIALFATTEVTVPPLRGHYLILHFHSFQHSHNLVCRHSVPWATLMSITVPGIGEVTVVPRLPPGLLPAPRVLQVAACCSCKMGSSNRCHRCRTSASFIYSYIIWVPFTVMV